MNSTRVATSTLSNGCSNSFICKDRSLTVAESTVQGLQGLNQAHQDHDSTGQDPRWEALRQLRNR